MKPIDVEQEALLGRSSTAIVSLVVLTTYSDRELDTVLNTYHFSEGSLDYDLGSGVEQFRPWVVQIEGGSRSMDHLPRRLADANSMTFRLRNGVDPEDALGHTLWRQLSDDGLEFADIMLAELAIDGYSASEWRDLTGATPGSHTVFFRGRVQLASAVTVDEIVLECAAEPAEVDWILNDNELTGDPRSMGRQIPIVYGRMKRTPCVGVDVGAVSSLAASIGQSDTSIELVDGTRFPSSGTGLIGREGITWASKTGDTLEGVIRGATKSHGAGEMIIELQPSATWLVAEHEVSSINDVWVTNLLTGSPFRLTTGAGKVFADTVTVPGLTVASIIMSGGQISAMLREMANTVIDDSTPPSGLDITQLPLTQTTDSFSNLTHARTGIAPAPEDAHSYRQPSGSFTQNFSFASVYVSETGTQRFFLNLQASAGGVINLRVPSVGIVATWDNTHAGGASAEPNDTAYVTNGGVFTNSHDFILESFQFSAEFGNFRREFVGNIATTTIDTEESPTDVRRGAGSGGPVLSNLFDDNLLTGYTQAQEANFLITFPALPADATTYGQRIWMYLQDGSNVEVRSGGSGGAVLYNMTTTTFNDFPTAEGAPAYLVFETDDPNTVLWLSQEAGSEIMEVKRQLITSLPLGDLGLAVSLGGDGIEMFADVDGKLGDVGFPTPTPATLMERPADILRDVITDPLIGEGTIDEASFEQLDLDLGANVLAVSLGGTDEDLIDQVELLMSNSRTNVFTVERVTGTEFVAQAAKTGNFAWPDPVLTITLWSDFIEEGLNPADYKTRFTASYAIRLNRGLTDAWDGLVRIDAEESDVGPAGPPSDADLVAAEQRYGKRRADRLEMFGIQEQETAREVTSYYAHEGIRQASLFEIRGVPHVESYAVERGDIVSVVPPTRPGLGAVKARVLSIERNVRTRAVTLRCVEVV